MSRTDPNKVLDKEWRALIQSIWNGRCILILGPNLVTDEGVPDARPVSEILAGELQEELSGDAVPPDFKGTLPLVGQAWLVPEDNYPADLQIRACDAYRTRTARRESKIHTELARLPFRICLTTTPDHLMIDALQTSGQGKEPHWAYYNHEDDPDPEADSEEARIPEDVPKGSPEKPLVYGLMGGMENPASVIVQEGALLDALFQFQRGSTALPGAVASELIDSRNTFLFIGFDFERCYARLLVHALKRNRIRGRTRSLGVAGRDFVVREEPVAADQYFKIVHSIEIRHTNWYEFAKELGIRFEKDTNVPARGPRPPPGSPKVFLCHDSRDRERVEWIEILLNKDGIDTWRDVDDLRGGTDWDRRIKHVLDKQVDYVLVCESPNMKEEGEKYFRTEINVALSRQERFGDGMFLVPGTIAGKPGCDNCWLGILGDRNRLDLTSLDGIKRLCREIMVDWGERKKPARSAPNGK